MPYCGKKSLRLPPGADHHVDESKVVEKLGKFPLPVEVVPFGYQVTMQRLYDLGFSPQLRTDGGQPCITDNGNFIIDCRIDVIDHPGRIHDSLNKMVGIVENGLFIGYASQVIVGYHDGSVKELKRRVD